MNKAGVDKEIRAISIIIVFSFLIFISELHACGCGNIFFTGINKSTALIDSLNTNYYNDTSFINALKDSVSNAKLCFIGKIESLKRDSLNKGIETITVSCARKIKGNIPNTFKAVNYAGYGDCIISADSLVGKEFLCILDSDTIPTMLKNLGISVGDCGNGIRGIFVTQKRIVTFVITCAMQGPYNCYVSTRNGNLQQFLNLTFVHPFYNFQNTQNKIIRWHGAMRNRMFLVNGRSVLSGKNTASRYFAQITDSKENFAKPFILVK